jgi:hypothetical protein
MEFGIVQIKKLRHQVHFPKTKKFKYFIRFRPSMKDAESFIVIIFKSDEKRDISCYCGISILSVIPKLFEKMVCHKLPTVIRPRISDTQGMAVPPSPI